MSAQYNAPHVSCAVCSRPTQFDLDTDRTGRLRAYPAGDTIVCGICQQFVCGDCLSPDRTVCRACAACADCKRDAGANAVRVIRGTQAPHEPLRHALDETVMLCPDCHASRVLGFLG